MTSSPPFAIIGCGAISEEFYLPAVAKLAGATDRLWVVDPSPARLEDATERFGVRKDRTVASIDDLPSGTAFAFNATPSHLHLTTSLALIERGISVFLEKPFAETAEDARAILAAGEGKVVLSSNQFRRLYPAYGAARDMIRAGTLGTIRRIRWDEGYRFDWPTQSGFYFRRPWQGRPRGALIDTGVHLLDVICWWLGTQPSLVEATMDGFGGPECYAAATLQSGETTIDIRVSFLTRLRNEYVIEGDEGSVRGSILDMRRLIHTPRGGSPRAVMAAGPPTNAAIGDLMIANFEQAALGREEVIIDAASVVPSLAVIDEIYASATSELPGYYKEWVA
jgi:predicted dehydrogenase